MAAKGGGDMGDAGLPQERAGGIATGSEIGRGTICADLAGVFTQRDVTDVLHAVLDRTVAAPQLLQSGGIHLVWGQTGEGIGPLLARRAGPGAADIRDFAVDATDLG